MVLCFVQGILNVCIREDSRQVNIHCDQGRASQKEQKEGEEQWGQTHTRLLASSYLFVSDQEAVGVLVFTRDFIVGKQSHQLLDKPDHFLVPGYVGHGEAAGCTLATVGHALRKDGSYRPFCG